MQDWPDVAELVREIAQQARDDIKVPASQAFVDGFDRIQRVVGKYPVDSSVGRAYVEIFKKSVLVTLEQRGASALTEDARRYLRAKWAAVGSHALDVAQAAVPAKRLDPDALRNAMWTVVHENRRLAQSSDDVEALLIWCASYKP
jgi:hypothetical protein